jgi:hypothetical protein
MSANGLNVGVDFSFFWYDNNTGTIVDFGDVQSVNISGQKHDIASRPYNQVPTFAFIPDGYKGTFEVVRVDSSLEDLQIQINQSFNAGSQIKSGYLNEVVNNPDGSVSTYQYVKSVFYVTKVVDVSREKVVTMSIEMMASDKVKIS